jgi:putative ABC transport system ATP-binding protein
MVMQLLSKLNQKGTTIVMVTHAQAYASYAQRVVHLFDGHLVTDALI